MIPILYDKNEVSFISNGLGRLRDCLSCTVTEERNGIYECDFEYPITGVHYKDIQLGRIIGVTHDDSGDVQPFDIVSFEKPINGIVTFHAVHISYRQSYLTVTGSNISSLADAFTALNNAEPNNPFAYQTDKTSTGFVAAFNGTPHSVRQLLGGVEGSILDAYGGEYEWDKFIVKLYGARGQARDFSIRYGLNMLEYNDNTDISGTYSSCIPYWTDGTTTVLGDRVDSSGLTATERGECVPLDLSDKFDSEPTKSAVETLAASIMASKAPYLPTQTISVSFVRLQDMSEYNGFESLLQCRLCDTVKVVFPDYKTSGKYKIVKTVWDSLMDRYESMELGTLSTTLSEALGITNSFGQTVCGGGGQTVHWTLAGTATGGTQTVTVPNTATEVFVTVDFNNNTQSGVSGYSLISTLPARWLIGGYYLASNDYGLVNLNVTNSNRTFQIRNSRYGNADQKTYSTLSVYYK